MQCFHSSRFLVERYAIAVFSASKHWKKPLFVDARRWCHCNVCVLLLHENGTLAARCCPLFLFFHELDYCNTITVVHPNNITSSTRQRFAAQTDGRRRGDAPATTAFEMPQRHPPFSKPKLQFLKTLENSLLFSWTGHFRQVEMLNSKKLLTSWLRRRSHILLASTIWIYGDCCT